MSAVVMGTSAALPGAGAWAVGPPSPYAFAADAPSVEGSTSTADAERLAPGTTYRSSLPVEGAFSYRLDLDATSTAYVAVTAVPPPGTTVAATEGMRVSVQDGNSHSCSIDTVSIGADRRPRPLTALGTRDASRAGTRCQEAGAYYLVVERIHKEESAPDAWDLEIATVSEPRLDRAGETNAPEVWDSASPEPVTGEVRRRAGGLGFATATSVGQGAWRDDILPGETLFYAVPVDWGQQLHATAELSSSGGGDGVVARALTLSLYNPVRGYVDGGGVLYDGSQREAGLRALPPVAYPNRNAVADRVSGMRFAGAYYLAVHLSEQVADKFGDGPFGMTLRVGVSGAPKDGPGYVGESEPRGVFAVTGSGGETVAGGDAVGGGGGDGGGAVGGGDTSMKLLAVGGIGGGTVLLAVLGVWVGVGRRRVGVGG
ncbi:hypothetical protein [Streptomyces lincolnensis]|uniref:hypothetical protein n=1 Tax=Streptomyces lincolnensis TaxID=1915 RepID=UPI0027E27A5E|nr:hypothetical protein [Streptomyces lincolnensis]